MFNLQQYREAQFGKSRDMKEMLSDKYAPYAVVYGGQASEWYGNDEMTEGRYKNKGQGGKILAINIPSMEMALNVTTEMEKKLYEPRNLQGTGIHGRKGRDRFIVTDVVIFPISMSALKDRKSVV